MVVTPLENVTQVRPVQAENAFVPDGGDAIGNRDAGQFGAGFERIVPDGGDAVWNRVASGCAGRKCDERSLVLVEQDPIQAAIGRIVCIHRYRYQAVAA